MFIAECIIAVSLVTILLALALGGPSQPPPVNSINEAFRAVDFSDMPAISTYQGDDGAALAYRHYAPSTAVLGSVTLVHGSSASSDSMHPLAKALAAAGYAVYSLDVRGHGQSGARGRIAYVGQLESDLAAFVRSVHPPAPSTLAGFSSGGGFVLRFAGSPQQSLFDSYLLLSPFISQDAPNQRAGSGGWASVGVPRIIALALLNAVGVSALNGLTVTRFALNEEARSRLTPQYDFNLSMNFRPLRDYRENIRKAGRPCAILAGASDEVFATDKLEEIFRGAGKPWPVLLLPCLGHVQITLEPAAHQDIVKLVQSLQTAVQEAPCCPNPARS